MAELNQNSLGLEDTGGVENVNEFKFEPIKGYPMLNWRGKRPFTSTQYYPAQLKEVYGEEVDGWRNKIYWGDNLQVMSHLLKVYRGKIDLIYLDPPFDSKAEYKKKIELRSSIVRGDTNSFEEKQYSDLWNNDEYLQFMYDRLVLMKELLSKSGSIFLHCDWHKSHHLRCILDEIFGNGGDDGKSAGFKNEIIWFYKTGGTSSRYFARKHDTILFYTKSSDYKYNNNKDKSVVDTSKGYNPNTEHYFDEDGNRCVLTNPVDVWDIQAINAHDLTTRNGYPTQKPVALIEKIINAVTDPGDLVFDPFLGSGTTAEAAQKLNRRYIVSDINLASVEITSNRILEQFVFKKNLELLNSENNTGLEIYNLNNYDLFRNPAEAKSLIIEALEITALENSSLFDGEKDGRMVKIMPINRISTKADLGELITGFDYKTWQSKQNDKPNQPVEKILLVCMGHEPSLKAELELAAKPFKIDVEVLDILRDKSNLEFKRDSEALVVQKNSELVIERFYPMNLLQKLSLQKETVTDWREMVESIMIDWNYDGAVLQPSVVDIPEKDALVSGKYRVPADAGTIRVKITDVLSESWEGGING